MKSPVSRLGRSVLGGVLNKEQYLNFARMLKQEPELLAKVETLERENAAMREAIREAHDLIQWLKTNSYGRHLRTASTAIAKLQPFLKP